MSSATHGHETCSVCGQAFPRSRLIAGALVRDPIAALIRKDHPDWSAEGSICPADLARYRADYVRSLLESEKGELSSLEEEVLESLHQHELLATNVAAEFEQARSFGQRLADRLASFGGSWKFLILFGVFLAVWIGMNTAVLLWRPIDPYPFILLNLVLSCTAAIQAPVIMMSQNRQEVKDRLRAEQDYKVNLKAELEIRHLHEKLDHLLSHQWERLVEIQQVQLELLAEIGRKR
jgi:uncharacterized membrane protein